MQGLHSTVHHFRKPGDFLDADDRDAFALERLGGAAGGDDLPAQRDELTREFTDAALVRNGEKGPHGPSRNTAPFIRATLSRFPRPPAATGDAPPPERAPQAVRACLHPGSAPAPGRCFRP